MDSKFYTDLVAYLKKRNEEIDKELTETYHGAKLTVLRGQMLELSTTITWVVQYVEDREEERRKIEDSKGSLVRYIRNKLGGNSGSRE
jgi:hypothetical protein